MGNQKSEKVASFSALTRVRNVLTTLLILGAVLQIAVLVLQRVVASKNPAIAILVFMSLALIQLGLWLLPLRLLFSEYTEFCKTFGKLAGWDAPLQARSFGEYSFFFYLGFGNLKKVEIAINKYRTDAKQMPILEKRAKEAVARAEVMEKLQVLLADRKAPQVVWKRVLKIVSRNWATARDLQRLLEELEASLPLPTAQPVAVQKEDVNRVPAHVTKAVNYCMQLYRDVAEIDRSPHWPGVVIAINDCMDRGDYRGAKSRAQNLSAEIKAAQR